MFWMVIIPFFSLCMCKSMYTWYDIYVFVKLIVYKLKKKKSIYTYLCVFARIRAHGDVSIARAAAETVGIKGNADGLGKKMCVLH